MGQCRGVSAWGSAEEYQHGAVQRSISMGQCRGVSAWGSAEEYQHGAVQRSISMGRPWRDSMRRADCIQAAGACAAGTGATGGGAWCMRGMSRATERRSHA